MKIGLIRETKLPVDSRTPLTPKQVKQLIAKYPNHDFIVQKSEIRAYTDQEYAELGIELTDDISLCDIILGIKEVAKELLIPDKTYLFFSHTAKMQPHNQKLLTEASRRKITLIDFEYLIKNGIRVVAFGYWAGIVGTYYALLGLGIQTKAYQLKRPELCRDRSELKKELALVRFPIPLKIVVTGEGRVASGALEMLKSADIDQVSPDAYLTNDFTESVFCQIGPQHYTKHRDGRKFSYSDFVINPQNYISNFLPYALKSDVFIPCHFWDNRSPVFFKRQDINRKDFSIRFIADISCDIPGPIPSTLRTSSIEEPFYGYDIKSAKETEPFTNRQITVMAIDNLPGILAREASHDFGDKLVNKVIPELLSSKKSQFIQDATILKDGRLTEKFLYLEEFLNEGLNS